MGSVMDQERPWEQEERERNEKTKVRSYDFYEVRRGAVDGELARRFDDEASARKGFSRLLRYRQDDKLFVLHIQVLKVAKNA